MTKHHRRPQQQQQQRASAPTRPAPCSDLRLIDPDSVRPIAEPIDRVMALEGVYFAFNDLARERAGLLSTAEHVGISAQAVEAAMPHAVATRLADFDLDTETGGSMSGESYLAVEYGALVPLLVEAVKAQKHELDLAKAELERLGVLVALLRRR